jgi:hypothetical protein
MIGVRRVEAVKATVPESKVHWLGRVGEYDYATYNGHEYAVEPFASIPGDYTPGAGELIVMRVTHEVFDGTPIESHTTHRAFRVTAGTYRRELEKAERRRGPPQAARLPVDALDGLSLLRPRADTVLPATTTSIVQTVLPVIPVTGAYLPGRRKVRGRAVLDHLERLGVTLGVYRGKLLVSSEKGRSAAVAEVVDRAGPLLLGWLTDQPLTCELDHAEHPPEAWTVLAGGLAVCQPHAEGVQS